MQFVVHDLVVSALHGHGMQQAVLDIAHCVGVHGQLAVDVQAVHHLAHGRRWGPDAHVALPGEHYHLVWPAQQQW